MANYYIAPESSFDATADAIRAKTGSQASIEWTEDGFADAIAAIPTGGGESEDNVIFIDYDGTIVESYTTAELLAMSALPSNPSHTGLTAQGWNWSLADAKAYVTAYPNADLIIGQVYVPTDGKTHIHICVEDIFDVSIPFDIKFLATVEGGVEIDWGDGSSKEYSTLNGTSAVRYSHIYAAAGDYDVTLNVLDGELKFNIAIYGASSNDSNPVVNRRRYRKIFIGNGASYKSTSFSTTFLECLTVPATFTTENNYGYFVNNCSKLKGFVFPSGVTTLGDSTFNGCKGLEYVSFPKELSTVGNYCFEHCGRLKAVCIPPSVTSIGTYFLYYAHATKVIVPSSVVSIGNNFADTSYCEEIELPGSITTLGTSLFRVCTNLKKVVLNEGITSISNSMFNTCLALEALTIPSTVTTIGTYAFQTSNISEIHLKPTSPPTISASSNASIISSGLYYVPYSSDHSVLNAYKTATNWSTLADQIIEEAAP